MYLAYDSITCLQGKRGSSCDKEKARKHNIAEKVHHFSYTSIWSLPKTHNQKRSIKIASTTSLEKQTVNRM